MEELYQRMEAIKDVEIKMKKLAKELAWCYVSEKKEELEKIEEKLEKLNEKEEQAKIKVANFDEMLKSFNEEIVSFNQSIAEYEEGLKPLSRQEEGLYERISEKKRMIGQMKREENEMKISIQNGEKKVKDLEKKIQVEVEKAETFNKMHMEQKMEKIKEIEAEIEEIRAERNENEEKHSVIRSSSAQAKKEIDSIKVHVRNTEKDIGEIKRNIQSLNSAKENDLLVYSREMPEILREIENAKFRKPPIGM
jgi:chromosome segregation ATPase